jgi:ATP phosphoribosyltransferase
MAVAAPVGFRDDPRRTLKVATKFAKIASDFYGARGRDIDIIHLNGSIELAPILGLSDVMVDIVETGTTLKENNLEVVETVVPISARLIANKASYKFKTEPNGRIVSHMMQELKG